MVDHKLGANKYQSGHVGCGLACSARVGEWKGIGFRGRYLALSSEGALIEICISIGNVY